MKSLFWAGFIVSVVTFLGWGTTRLINSVSFDRGCEGYLKRAADANTVEMAQKQLAVAVDFLEKNDLTSGYTSILYRTPDEDIGFWYENLTQSMAELKRCPPNASQLEASNVLMKLRETLLDSNESGDSVTVPAGIAIYPLNGVFAFLGWCSILGLMFFGVGLIFIYDNYY